MKLASIWFAVLAGMLFTGGLAAEEKSEIAGYFTDKHLATIKSMTLPRTFLYNAGNKFVPLQAWPAELAALKANVGDAYCCVSDDSNTSMQKGPPKNCIKKVYGQDISENFTDLVDGTNRPIALSAISRKKWLLVEYFADWCAPCLAERKALLAFFKTPASADYVWLSIDLSRLVEVQEQAKATKQ